MQKQQRNRVSALLGVLIALFCRFPATAQEIPPPVMGAYQNLGKP